MTMPENYNIPKWKVSRMAASMTYEFISVPECLLAILARVSFVVAFVNTQMFCQMLTLGKSLVTYVAHMRSG